VSYALRLSESIRVWTILEIVCYSFQSKLFARSCSGASGQWSRPHYASNLRRVRNSNPSHGGSHFQGMTALHSSEFTALESHDWTCTRLQATGSKRPRSSLGMLHANPSPRCPATGPGHAQGTGRLGEPQAHRYEAAPPGRREGPARPTKARPVRLRPGPSD
jgi:hypothetical protein